jgi:hypothetical protein
MVYKLSNIFDSTKKYHLSEKQQKKLDTTDNHQ